jgi:drug/metabolite transporter (DMT)-like permease
VSLLVMVSILRRHAASAVAALLLAVPAVTAIGSAVALGEALHPASLAGMLVAMAGIGAVLRREAPARPRAGFRRDVGSLPHTVCPPTGPAEGRA